MYKNIPIKTVDNGYEGTHVDNEHLVTMIHRLANERDILWRENEYLKAKLNESVLIETINEMKKERDLLLKLLLNLSTSNNQPPPPPPPSSSHKDDSSPYQNHYSDENSNGYSNDLLPPPPYQTYSPPTKKLPPPHSRPNQTHRDLFIPVTELKPTRRSHRPNKLNNNNPDSQPAVVYRVEGTKECLMNPDELSSVFAHVKHSHPNKKIVVYKTTSTPQTHEFNQLMDEMCIKHGVELKHSQNSPFQQYRSQSLQDLTTPQQRDFDFQFQPIEKHEPLRGNFTKK